jgi:hypothetical protein
VKSAHQLSPDKDIRKLISEAEERGWTVEPTGSGHLRFKGTHGQIVIVARTPKTSRAYHNYLARIRREEKNANRNAR